MLCLSSFLVHRSYPTLHSLSSSQRSLAYNLNHRITNQATVGIVALINDLKPTARRLLRLREGEFVTSCRPRPYKVARELRTPVPVRSQKYFPPCLTHTLQAAVSSSRRSNCSRRRSPGVATHCCHDRYNEASALLPPSLRMSCCGP